MAIAVMQRPEPQTSRGRTTHILPYLDELIAFCPGCKTMETLYFSDGHLMNTRKFNQTDGRIYHNCGATAPCRLYQNW